MADLYLHGIDADTLRAEIVSAVTDAIRPMLAEAHEPRLVDRSRMAELLGVSVPRLDVLVRDGVIPSRLIGKRRLFFPAEVLAAIPSATRNTRGTSHGA